MNDIYYKGKGLIDNTEVHYSFIFIRGENKNIIPLCNDKKRIKQSLCINSKVTCKKCLAWEKRIINKFKGGIRNENGT